jgi:DNA-binding MarR family transcriptional regulator
MLRRLARAGLISGVDEAADARTEGTVRPTERGAAVYAELLAAVQEVTARLYANLDPGELATAKRVLAQVVERANALTVELAG